MGLTTEEHNLAAALSALHQEIGALHGAVSRRFGLTVQQADLLCLLEHRRPSLGQLADLLGCDKTNVTGLVDRLAQRDLICRVDDPDDRRVRRVALTERGAETGARIRTEIAQGITRRLAGWPATRRRRLDDLASAAATTLAQGRVNPADHPSAELARVPEG